MKTTDKVNPAPVLVPGQSRSLQATVTSSPRAHPFGMPKDGVRVLLNEGTSVITLRGRADPLLVYLVFGAALAVAVGGSILVSPQYGVAAVVLFSLLFSPLLVFTSVLAARVRSACTVDRPGQRVLVEERSLLGEQRREWPLSALQRIEVCARGPSRWAPSGSTYELRLMFGEEAYLAKAASHEAGLRREAQKIARFLGVPAVVEVQPVHGGPTRPLDVALSSTLFLLPLVAATLVLAYVLSQRLFHAGNDLYAMGVLIVCQVGAILAYLYVRSRSSTGA